MEKIPLPSVVQDEEKELEKEFKTLNVDVKGEKETSTKKQSEDVNYCPVDAMEQAMTKAPWAQK